MEASGRLALVRERLNWIDWLKVLVVVGAFVFHAAQPFVYTEWLINDTDKSLPLSVASGFGYLFGMPLMFFLAGAATWLAVSGVASAAIPASGCAGCSSHCCSGSSSSARPRPGSRMWRPAATPGRSSSWAPTSPP